jgi:riboflavin kinase / FMN adenylyltransferase
MTEMVKSVKTTGLPADVAGTVVTVGTFDGVHRGHQQVLERVAARAAETGLRSLLVTFDPHPLEIVNPAAARPLLSVGMEKFEVLAESGIDYCAVLPFTPTLARYGPAEFIDHVLRARYRMREMISGYDNGFGRGRAGDVEMIRALGVRRGFHVEVVPPTTLDDGRPVSSTSIRRAIAGGDLKAAEQQLGRLYSVSGHVVAGAGRGRTLGIPTLNVPLPPARKLLPPLGVYAVRVQTPQGPRGGMLNLGPRPTFGEARALLEAHLFDTTGNFYGSYVRIEFVARLRDVLHFPDADALRAQLARDEEQARHILADRVDSLLSRG